MDDLISRAEALKALKDMSVTYDAETVQRCIEAVSNLPSAQPEDKCDECDAWNQYKNYPRPTIDAVPAEWIPVSEQMPEKFKTVLVFALSDDGDHGFMTTASHEGRGIWYDECFYQPLPKVYAWMPLPEPYLVKF